MLKKGSKKIRAEASIRWTGIIAGALLAAFTGLCLHLFSISSGLVRLSYDLLTVTRPLTRPDEAVMVYLDEESHRVLEQPYLDGWDRAIHAYLINRLTDAGAKAVVFDIVFSDPNTNDPEGDQLLMEAIRRNGRVILAADAVRDRETKGTKMDMPFDLVRDVAAGIGSAEVMADRDLIIRMHTPKRSLAGIQFPSLSYAAAQVVESPHLSPHEDPERWLRYYGPADFLPSVSYHSALDPERTPDEVFKDKVVIVGARLMTGFSADRADEYPTPYTQFGSIEDSSIFGSGVETQATAYLNLVRGDWLRRYPFKVERILVVLSGLLLGGLLARLRPFAAVGMALLAVAGTMTISYYVFQNMFLWFPWVIVVVVIVVALSWSVLFNTVQLYVQKQLIEQTLAIYLPPKLVKKFARDPQLLQPGAQKETMTFLFTDIAGFTSISEGMDSDDLADMMNQYFEGAVSGCIHETDGTVGKYIGDAILAFWNAPDKQQDHALRACQAALLFRAQEAQAGDWKGKKLRTRIGIHTGTANVGNFGSTQRVDYTVLGENVNLASRLEGLNKYLGTSTVISGDTREAIQGRIVTRHVGRFRLKGFRKPVEVHELIGDSRTEEAHPWREAFDQALKPFLAKDWGAAEKAFAEVLKLKPKDGPTQYYLEQIALLRSQNLPPEWQGEIELQEK